MSSIEDILNAEDSDDEDQFEDDVDLEHLLHSKDDNDELNHDCNDNLNLDSASTETGIVPTRYTRGRFDTFPGSDGVTTPNLESKISGVKIELEDEIFLESSEASEADYVVEQHEGIHLTLLEQADLREQRFLDSGQKDVISALQSKRTSSVLLNYSNVRCEELETITSQLKRNSSYKQHGPGSASSMSVCGGFIAVGTSKGLIILFDHHQEIRSVLGSNIANSDRPVSAVTVLDIAQTFSSPVGKGLEGLLVSGFASGELALWDVAKGTILKVVSDLHASPLTVLSILDSTSDGLVNIGGMGGDEVNLVSLPATWHFDQTQRQSSSGDNTSSVASSSLRSGFANSFTSATSSMASVSLVVISADSEGVMYKSRFSKTMWSAGFACESECLLDSSTGPLSGYAPLPPILRALQANSAHFYKSRTNVPDSKVCCRYVAAHRTARLLAINVGKSQTWIVQTHPKIKILFKWDVPTADSKTPEAAVDDPLSGCTVSRCLDWTWVAQWQEGSRADQVPIFVPVDEVDRGDSKEGVDWVPTLARCWGEEVQLMSVLTTAAAAATIGAPSSVTSGAFQDSGNKQSVSSAFNFLGVSTATPSSSSSSKAPLATDQPSFQTRFSVTHRNRFAGQKVTSLRWVSSTELVLLTTSDVVVTNQMLETLERFSLQPSLAMELNISYNALVSTLPRVVSIQHNVYGKRLFVSVNDTIVSVQMQSCFELAERLTEKGQWLEALALVLENVRRSPSMLQHYGDEVDRYIVRYAELAVKHPGAPVAGGSASSSAVSSAQSKNHFHLVAGVCIEYCVACARLDLLFSRVYTIFKSVQRHYVFLEALEPFILSKDISSLPPSLIAEFCESALRLHRLPSIERCVAYFEIAHLDMNFITKFLYENRMFSSFLYVYAHGLNDFSGAFQIIFNFMLVSGREDSSRRVGDSSPPPQDENTSDFSDVGYKLMLYLDYSFAGRVFPRGDAMEGPHGDVSWQLLQLVVAKELRPTPSIFALQSAAELQKTASRIGPYPYLKKLSQVDQAAVLHVLYHGLLLAQSHGNIMVSSPRPASQLLISPAVVRAGLPTIYENILEFYILSDEEKLESALSERSFFEQFTDLIVESKCCLTPRFLRRFLDFCNSAISGQDRAKYESKLVSLAKHQTREDVTHAIEIVDLLSEHNFWLASWHVEQGLGRGTPPSETFRRGLGFYIKEGTDHPEMKRFAFDFIDEAFRSTPAALGREEYQSALCAELLKAIVPLCYLDLPESRHLVQRYLSSRVFGIIENSAQDLKMQFALLNALIPSSDGIPGERGRLLMATFDAKKIVVYFNLLATYDPLKALDFLKAFESYYPLDECLQICRRKGISEAVAFLMERTGEVLDALLMLLKDFTVKLKQIRRDIDAQLRSEMAAQAAAAKANLRIAASEGDRYLITQILAKQDVERADATKRLPCFKMLESLINCVADLCNRSSPTDQAGMWLTAFDHLLMERRE